MRLVPMVASVVELANWRGRSPRPSWKGRTLMKYVLTWWERPGGSYADYEAAQKRVLNVFEPWEMPESLDIQQFVVRVGEFGGYMVLETDSVADVQKLTTTFAVFQFRLEPVMDVMDAVAAEAEAIAWREENASSP